MIARKTIILLTILLAWLGGAGSVWADSTVSTWDGITLTPPTQKDADNYYQIWTAAQWAHVSANPPTYQNTSFRFYSDIDMGNHVMNQILGGNDLPYYGSIDGQNHTIKGLNIRRSTYDTGGVVGWLSGGTIQDLNVQGYVYSSGGFGCGGICTWGSGTVRNCTFTGTVEYTNDVGCGGIVGKVVGTMTIENCTFDGTVIAPTYAGALVGSMGNYSVGFTGSRYTEESIVVVGSTTYTTSNWPAGIGIGDDGAPHGDYKAQRYIIYTNAASVTNGSFTVKNLKGLDIASSIQGLVVYITAVPNTGYYPIVTVKDADNAGIALTETGEANQYSFPMPAKDVTVSVTFGAYINNVSISDISAPVTLSAFDNVASCTTPGVASISGVTWKDGSTIVSGSAQVGKAYTAEVTLTPSSGYQFTNSTAATVNGSPASSVMKIGDNLKVTYTFPATVKLNPIITTPPTASDITYGQTLANSTLSGGVVNTPGTFTWTDNTIAPSVSDSQNTPYGVTFTPTDKTNYNTVTTTVKLTIHPRHISEATITVADMAWTGGVLSKLQGAVDGYTIQYNGNNLTLNDDYTFFTSPATIHDAGTYSMCFLGVGNYTGSTVKTFNVKKDIGNQNHTSISVRSQYQIVPDGSTETTPVIEITDNATGNTLVQGTDFGISPTVIGADVSTEITITGMAPRYSGSASLTVKGLKEYYARSTEPNSAVFDIHLTETTATGANATLGNTAHSTVIDPNSAALTIPPFLSFTSGATITITDIEDGAFTGCGSLRYIDAIALTDFTPSSLLRDIEVSPFYGVPKQALVYLSGIKITGENYVYYPGVGSTYYCDVFKVYDDLDGNQQGFEEAGDYKWAFENRYPFTANTIVNTRMLLEKQHYTTCLPYDLPIPEGVKAYTLNATSDKLLGFKEVTGKLEAYHPYVIIPTVHGQLLSTTNAEVPAFMATDADAKKLNHVSSVDGSTSTFTMYGTMRYVDGAEANDLYIMQGKNANGVCTWKQIQDDNGSYTDAEHRYCVLPMRAYIKSDAALSRPLLESAFTNGVSESATTDSRAGDALYDLQGRKIQTPQRKGIYIMNGRKVVINKK